MKSLIIKASNLTNIVVLIASLIISYFFFLFGISNYINPDVPDAYLTQNTVACIIVCLIGLGFLLIAIASLRGILYKNKKKRKNN
jgi:hypothetical protein